MSILSTNLKYLRHRAGFSQQELSDRLAIARTTLGDYERGKTEPNVSTLILFSDLYDINLDRLLTDNVSLMDIQGVKNDSFKILAITVDVENNGNIELVDTKAEAGYLQSFQDPEYIKELPKIAFPNIPQGTFRGFEISGDSMMPIEEGSIIICEYIEKFADLKNGKTYIVVTKDDGLVYKRILQSEKNHKLILFSDNEDYSPYEVDYNDIKEMWQYYAHLSFSDAKTTYNNLIDEKLNEISREVKALSKKL